MEPSELHNLTKAELVQLLVNERRENEQLIKKLNRQSFRIERLTECLAASGIGWWEWYPQGQDDQFDYERTSPLVHDEKHNISPVNWKEKSHPDDRTVIDKAFSNYMKAFPGTWEGKFRLKDSSGGFHEVKSIGKVTGIDEEHKALGAVGVYWDERNQVKEPMMLPLNGNGGQALAKNAVQFESLLNNLLGMVYRYVKHEGWTFEYVSEGCKVLTGYQPDEYLTKGIGIESHLITDIDYKESVQDAIKLLLRGKDAFNIIYPIKTKEGEEKWVMDSGIAILDNNGELIAIEGFVVDVTEQKNKEIQAKLAQFTIDKAPIAIEWIASDGTFYYINEIMEELSGFGRSDLIGSKINEVFDFDMYEVIPGLSKEDWDELLEERMFYGLKDRKLPFVKKDGTVISVLMSSCNIEYEGRVYNCAYINDITELKKAELELQRAYDELSSTEEELRQHSETLIVLNENLEWQKTKLEQTVQELKNTQNQLIQAEKMASLGVLVAGIAHELNNPINYISTGGDALKILLEDIVEVIENYEEVTPENFAEKMGEIRELKASMDFDEMVKDVTGLVENINSGVDRASEIIKGLRVFSRMDGGKIELYDIHKIIDDTLLILYNSYKYTIQVYKEYGEVPEIECYPNKLNQVFLNIISNAIQSIKETGEIHITTGYSEKHEGDFIVVKIKDSGGGIPEEIQNRIFEPFFTTKEPGEGTGLGLAISLGILEDHTGSLEFDSVEGVGTTFKVYLPIKLNI